MDGCIPRTSETVPACYRRALDDQWIALILQSSPTRWSTVRVGGASCAGYDMLLFQSLILEPELEVGVGF